MAFEPPSDIEEAPSEGKTAAHRIRRKLRRVTANLDRYAQKNRDLFQLLACAAGLTLGVALGSILVTSLPSHGSSKSAAPPLLTSTQTR